MTYQGKADAYADPATRARIAACSSEQAYVYVNDGRPDIAWLAQQVIALSPQALSALAAGVCSGPNGENLAEDGPLVSAVQSIWPTVAAALYVPPVTMPAEESA